MYTLHGAIFKGINGESVESLSPPRECTSVRSWSAWDMTKKALYLLLTIFLALTTFAGKQVTTLQDEVTKRKEKLSDIDRAIKEKKKDIIQAEQQELSTITQLNAIDEKLSKNHEELSVLNQRMKMLTKEVSTTTTQLQQINEEIAQRRELFNKRLVALYQYERSGGIVKILFSSHSYPDLVQRAKFIRMILQGDLQTIQQFLADLTRVKEKRTTLQEKHASQETVKSDILKKSSEITTQKQKKTALLEKIKKEKQTYQSAVKELEKSSLELQSLIDRLEREIATKKKPFIPERGKGFASLKGKLPYPVAGSLISRYGNHLDPQLNTVTFQKGIEIAAAWGEEVRAIHKGTVLYADWFKGYGNIIIIDHGDSYYSLCAHVSKILKGVEQEVQTGEVIALAGDTGSLKGPCVYFELRYQGKPLDPLQWLQPH
jgi:septal ring factor EnvC (AmiA/AmiB activator)